jgi:negative regulator of flagellin synthesis FlgM
MQIKPQSGVVRPEVAGTAPATKSDKPVAAAAPVAAVGTTRSDNVQISDAGRALAARGGTSSLSPERAAQVRQRVLDGAYNSLTVVDEVARRILGSGDL